MSTFKHPVGPQPNKVYWRRRLAVGIGLLVVVLVVVLIFIRPGASDGDPVGVATNTPTTSKSAPASPTPKPAKTTIPTKPATVEGAPCVAENVRVKAITDAANYAADQSPKLSLSLTNTGSKSCSLDAGTAMQVYTITSGTEVYWMSSDCQSNPVHTEILLEPGKTVTSVPFEWDRTRSDPKKCSGDRDPVPAGGASYHLSTKVGSFASETTKQFILE